MTDDEALDRVERESDAVRLQIAHAHARLYEREKERKDARRQYAREYYAAHRDEQLEYQRQRRQAQRTNDPERYGQLRRGRAQRWHERHKDDENAKQRAKYRANPQPHLERRAKYYAEHAEEIKAKRRARYAADKDAALTRQQELRDRDQRRRALGLPVRRLHTTTVDELRANEAAAAAFFAHKRTARQIRQMRSEGAATPPELVAAWGRDCARARAAHRLAEQREELARLQKELARAPRTHAQPRQTPEERENARLEEERLDEIARQLNDRLRHRDPPRHPHHLDPTAPHPMLQQNSLRGLDR